MKQEYKKIVRGALIAATGAAALALLDYLGTIQISDPTVAMLSAWVVPTVSNAVKVYFQRKREESDSFIFPMM